jgi:predicted nuclease of predicted toxin-antitoxin system
MRILIDECVDPRVKQLFGEHQSATVHDKGWDTLEDGPLLALAQKEFDVLPTIDGNYRVIQKELPIAVEEVQPGRVIHVRTPPA